MTDTELAEELFKKKPLGYEMKPGSEIYTEGFEDGYKKATEKFNRQGLALQSDMDKTIEQNIVLKKQLVEKGQHLDLTEREWAKDTSKMICYKTQFTKAKALLKQFLEAKNGEDTYKAEWEAEQFLKENE